MVVLDYSNPNLTAKEVSTFFDEVPQIMVNVFTYQKEDGTLLGIKDFFEAYYHSSICRYKKNQIDVAKKHFHLIFSDNTFILYKLKQEASIYKELADIDKNWKTVSTSQINNTLEGTNNQTDKRNETNTETKDLISGTLRGTVDASQLMEIKQETMLQAADQKIMGYLDPNTRSREHSIHRDSGTDTMASVGTNTIEGAMNQTSRGTTTTATSNSSEDYQKFLSLALPEMRKSFLDKFSILFYF